MQQWFMWRHSFMRHDRWITWGFEIVIKVKFHVCCPVCYHLSYLFPVFNHKSPEWLKVISQLCAALLPFACWGRKRQNKWKIQIHPSLPTELQLHTNRHRCVIDTHTAWSLSDGSFKCVRVWFIRNEQPCSQTELLINLRCCLSSLCVLPYIVSPVLLWQGAAGAWRSRRVSAGDPEEDSQGSAHLHPHQLRRYSTAHTAADAELKEQPRLTCSPQSSFHPCHLVSLWSSVRRGCWRLCDWTACVSSAIRFCDRCQLLKPDRCHHCSVCDKYGSYREKTTQYILHSGRRSEIQLHWLVTLLCYRCILKMDHHCPWYVAALFH